MKNSTPVKVYLVDDHAVVREGYKHLLEKANIQVVAEAESGEQAFDNFDQLKVDVIVMDLSMPGVGGIETIKKIVSKDKRARILAFSMHDDVVFSARAMQAGAKGYVTKSCAPSVLVEAVFAVANNKKYLSLDVAKKITSQNLEAEDSILNNLSQREFEVFQMLAKGLTLEEIAKL
ncbi:MAG: response regulator transcription factor, partial [Methylotenera sp.]|uniref:response regulator transcription factor n=1 Tax=Methylotenera sp. TaxID=2051956 RepID=UPI001792EDB3